MTPHDMAVTRLACSWLLWYPDEALAKRVPDIRSAIQDLPAEATQPLTDFLAWMSAQDPLELAKEYVQTFDMKRKACPYLTYWTHGDTRNRGMAILHFKQAYLAAGFDPGDAELRRPPRRRPGVRRDRGSVDRRRATCRAPRADRLAALGAGIHGLALRPGAAGGGDHACRR
ncbi:MAG: nitrate reductase molybdenum cofactor assembly chaperone [Candidatus Nanopelagicales bacterium]